MNGRASSSFKSSGLGELTILDTEEELSLEKWLILLSVQRTLLCSCGISVGCVCLVSSVVPGCKFVVKAQVLAGGRGKGHWENGMQGGVKLAKTYSS